MKRKNDLPELLAPAGDIQCLYAAVKGGADAVYVGGRSFGARAFAKNFDIDELAYAVRYCHIHGVKLYVTMNILLFDNELSEALEFTGGLEYNRKAEQLKELLAVTGVAPSECLYVGDVLSDITLSREAGITCLSAAWAPTADVNELKAHNPDLVFFSFEELVAYILARI